MIEDGSRAARERIRRSWHSILTIWNVVLGLAVMLWAFGYGQVKELLSKKGAEQTHEQPGV